MAENDGSFTYDFDVSTQAARDQIELLGRKVKDIVGTLTTLRQELRNAFDVSAMTPLQQLRQLKGGSADTQVRNAVVQGQGAQLNASDLGAVNNLLRQQFTLVNQIDQVAKQRARDLTTELADTEKLSSVDRARLELARRLKEARAAIAAGGGAIQGEHAEQIIGDVTGARVRLEAAQATERAAATQARVDAQSEKVERQRLAVEEKVTAERERQLGYAQRDALADDKRRTQSLLARGIVPPENAERNAAIRTNRYDQAFGDGGQALFQLQARLYAQYAVINTVINAFKGLTQGVVELDQEMRNLQAISGSTDAQMEGLKTTILDVGQTSRFSLTELAQGATTMAQAGLNAQQIAVALKGTVELAAASGSTLKDSVDLVTTALTVFNLRAEETGKIGDLVSVALNQSKLTVDKFASGLQYAGNIAAEAGDDLQDLSAFLAVLANAGLKGSNAGTGLREIYIQLQKPSEEFRKQLEQVGLTAEQVDVKTNGLTGVLHNLADAGFSSANAIQAFGTRGAAAFVALDRGLSDVDRFEGSFRNADGAAAAAGVQMEGLEAKLQRLGSSATAAASVLGADLTTALGKVVDAVAGSLKVIQDNKTAVEVLGTVLGSLATGVLAVTVARFTGLAAVVGSVGTALSGITGAATLAGAGTAALTALLNPVLAITVALTAAIAYATDGFGLWASSADTVAGKLETLRTGINESKGKADEYRGSIEAVDAATTTLADRGASLEGNQTALNQTIQTAQQRFGDLGLRIDGASHSVTGLLAAYNDLRGTLAKGLGNTLRDEADKLGQQGAALKEQLDAKDFKTPAAKLLGRFGYNGSDVVDQSGGEFGGRTALLDSEGAFRAARLQNPALAGAADTLANSNDRDQLQGAKKALQDLLTAGGVPPDQQEALRDAIKELTGKIGTLVAIDQARTGAEEATANAGKSDLFATGKPGNAVQGVLANALLYFQEQTKGRLEGITDPTQRKAQASQLQVESLGSLASHLTDALQGVSPEDKAKIDEVVGKDITELRQKILGAAGGVTEEAGKELDKVAQGRLSDIGHELEQLSKKLGGKSTGDDKTVLAQIKPLLDEKAAIQKQIFEDNNPNKWELAASNAKRVDGDTKEEFQGYAEKAADAFKRVRDANLQENISLLNEQAQIIERRFTGRNPKGTDADLAQLKSLWDRLDQAAIQAKKAMGLTPKQLADEIAVIKQKRADREEDFADRRAKATTTAPFQFRPVNDDLVGSLKAPMTLIDKQFSNAAREIEAPLKLLETRLGGLDIPGAAQNQPSYLKDQLGQEGEGLRTEQLRSLSVNDSAKRAAIEAQVAELTDSRTKLEAQLASLTETLQARDGQPKQPGDDKLQAQYDETATRVKALDDAIALGEENMQKAGDSAAESLAEYQARADALKQSNLTYAQVLSGSYQAWARSAGLMDSNLKIVGDTATATFDAMRGGIADWAIAVTSGTQTAGQAFKSFGISMLQTLQKIAAEKFANALISLLADGISAGFNYFNTPTATTTAAPNTAVNGLLGHAASGGLISGGTAGRDSVPTMLMPGEFVLTKSAVDAIGQDHVANMNKTGRAATQMVRTLAPVMAGGGGGGSPVHVYVVSQDQVPPPGEREIVAHVASNISRGGSLKQLIKTVNR